MPRHLTSAYAASPLAGRARGWIAAVLLAASTLLTFAAASPAAAQPTPAAAEQRIRDVKQRWQDLHVRLDLLRSQRKRLEGRYDALTQRIAAAKREAKPLGGLDSLLADARSLANELNALQEELRQIEGHQEAARQELLDAYQTQIQGLEQTLLTSRSADERKRAIDAINALKKERFPWTQRDAPTPDLNLQALPSLKSLEGADPDELQAVAAELDDNERRLRSHIASLQSDLDRLERERRLRQKAADFSEEESFFDETSRNRRIARTSNRVFGPSGDAAGSDKGDTRGNAAGGAADPTPNNDAEAPAVGGAEAAEPDSDFGTAAPGGDNLGAGRDDQANNPPPTSTPEVGPTQNLPGAGAPTLDPFATPGVIVRADVQLDGLGASGAARDNESLESRLQRLRREKERMERQADELQRRSLELKRRAHEL